MKGEKSGVETSAINFWGASIQSRFLCFGSTLRTLFIPSLLINHIRRGLPVTASSLVSGNELAIQMGLPATRYAAFRH